MIGYLDWAQLVLDRVLAERPSHQSLTTWLLADELGHPLQGASQEEEHAIIGSLDHVLTDLARHGLVEYTSGNHYIEYPSAARRFRVEPLMSVWPELRSGFLMPDDETFLAALVALSEQRGETLADVGEVDAADVFASLKWQWDGDKALSIFRHLKELFLLEGVVFGGPSIQVRATYAGIVRAMDEAGSLLREAEDHLHAHRLRAAGCVAAVELERRLKRLVRVPPQVSRRRDPSLDDYNKAAFESGVIDQETWEAVSMLAAIRKRCVHVLDSEPEPDEVRRLIDGVERILRRYSAPDSDRRDAPD